MRGTDGTGGALFSHVDPEERIPARHRLRKIRQVVNDALVSLDAVDEIDAFDDVCAMSEAAQLALALFSALVELEHPLPVSAFRRNVTSVDCR